MTLADARMTQAQMDRDLGAQTVARVAFHGQHTVGALLDASGPAALKAALGELVEADTWAEAKETSRKRPVSEQRGKRSPPRARTSRSARAYVRRAEDAPEGARPRPRAAWDDDVRAKSARLVCRGGTPRWMRARARKGAQRRGTGSAPPPPPGTPRSARWRPPPRSRAEDVGPAREHPDGAGIGNEGGRDEELLGGRPVIPSARSRSARLRSPDAERLRAVAADARGAEARAGGAHRVAADAPRSSAAFQGLKSFSRRPPASGFAESSRFRARTPPGEDSR